MLCVKPIRINIKYKSDRPSWRFPDGLEVPCGRCVACRIQRRNEWALRLEHELEYWNKSMFITLTYNDDHLPDKGSLKKKDLQNFFKRLRKNSQRKIKYFASGEYGDTTLRPHYHAIIFGLDLNDKQLICDNWTYCDWDNKDIYNKSFGLAEPDSITYVCKYVDKVESGDFEAIFKACGIEPPFKISSQGIGLQYMVDNINNIINQGYLRYKNTKKSIPRYYLKKCKDFGLQTSVVRHTIDVETITGIAEITADELYKSAEVACNNVYIKRMRGIRQRRRYHLEALNRLRKASL